RFLYLIILGAAGKNPFSRPLSYSAFIPWIGAASRIGQTLPKTEALKCMPSRKTEECQIKESTRTDEDKLIDFLESGKVKSVNQMLPGRTLNITHLTISVSSFSSLKVIHMGCMHSVVFYHFPLWWQESAGDHSDALLSFKHPPNMYISDIAGRVARHTNNRTEQKYFQPHDGRLCAATEENIQSAQEKTLKIYLPWLAALKFKGLSVQTEHAAVDRYTQVHPFTGTSIIHSMIVFMKKNQTRPEERLRSMTLLPELSGIINTSEAEQLNRQLASCRYFICEMKDTHFIFALRLIFHLHNEKIN
ncbi:hypothetical protein AOXY_G3720, partial [Acipenser oxyrinchus oxyrinchus]